MPSTPTKAVLLDVETWENINRRLSLLEGIARGERAFSEGRTVSHDEAKKRLGKHSFAANDGCGALACHSS